jgi:hypothetical protein
MVRPTLWTHTKDPYEIFQLVLNNPRIPGTEIARKLNVNPKTAEDWWNIAVKNRIIIPPVLRRRSFLNFREYFYFVRVNDPHSLYEELQKSKDIVYSSVQTGFANFQMIAETPLSLESEVILAGQRSNYHVSIPPHCSFKESISRIGHRLENLDRLTRNPSPLIYQKKVYGPWDELDEAIYCALSNNLRKPFTQIIESTGAYSDKIMAWFRNRDKFGNTITMFFPEGESSYQLSLFCVEISKSYDWFLIDLFSQLPTSSVFYRIRKKLMMCIYLPFFPSPDARIIVRKVLSILQKKELVKRYTNSIVEYYKRP